MATGIVLCFRVFACAIPHVYRCSNPLTLLSPLALPGQARFWATEPRLRGDDACGAPEKEEGRQCAPTAVAPLPLARSVLTHSLIYTYRSLGVVSDKIASAKRNPVQTGNSSSTTTTTTTTTTTNDNNNNGRCEGESQGKTRVLGSVFTIYMEQIKINGAGGSVTVVANPWVRRFPVSVRFCCPCVARDRWHRAWPAIDGTVRGPREILFCV